MKNAIRLLLALALTAAAVSGLPLSSFAGGSDVANPAGLQTTPGGPAANSWVGGGAAIGCGFGIRYAVLGGANPFWLVGTGIMCLIMLADGMNT